MASEIATSSVLYLPQSATVFRIRRKRTADPHEALIVSLKRPRRDDSLHSDIFIPLLFQLAATSDHPNISSVGCMKLLLNTPLTVIDYEPTIADEHIGQQGEADYAGRGGENASEALNDRAGVVGASESGVDHWRNRLSAEQIRVSETSYSSLGSAEQPGYVFDFYWNAHGIQHPIDQLEIRMASREEVELYTGEGTESSADADEEDDSNSENNWRNDYPDEESQDDTYDDSEEEYCSEGDLEHRFYEFRWSVSERSFV